MSIHWTYTEVPPLGDDVDIAQGDIITPLPELMNVISEIHPHFADQKYMAFLVLTQSCDLVRRKGSDCGADHITLCVIRDLDSILPKLIGAKPLSGSIYPRSKKDSFRMFLERLFNQNEQTTGLFYFHPDRDSAGIDFASVAFLRIKMVLKNSHYDILKQSRIGRLAPEFRDKLGWLVGNLYSRVGTTDWEEHNQKDEFDELVNFYMDEVAWVEERLFNLGLKSFSVDQPADSDPKAAFDEYLEQLTSSNNRMRYFEQFETSSIREVLPKKLKEHFDAISNKLVADMMGTITGDIPESDIAKKFEEYNLELKRQLVHKVSQDRQIFKAKR